MASRSLILVAALLCGASMSPVAAAPIVYDVNLTIGSGSVVGSITTTGTLGELTGADITGFNLTLNGIGASTTISSSSASVLVQGSDVIATASTLSFDFSGVDNGFLLFQRSLFSGMEYFCSATSSGTCYQGESVVPQSYNDPSAVIVSVGGEQVIGTVSAVPLPASAPLFGTALLALGAMGYRVTRKAKA